MEVMPQADLEADLDNPDHKIHQIDTVATGMGRALNRLARMSDVLGPELMRQYMAEDAAAQAEARRVSRSLRPPRPR